MLERHDNELFDEIHKLRENAELLFEHGEIVLGWRRIIDAQKLLQPKIAESPTDTNVLNLFIEVNKQIAHYLELIDKGFQVRTSDIISLIKNEEYHEASYRVDNIAHLIAEIQQQQPIQAFNRYQNILKSFREQIDIELENEKHLSAIYDQVSWLISMGDFPSAYNVLESEKEIIKRPSNFPIWHKVNDLQKTIEKRISVDIGNVALVLEISNGERRYRTATRLTLDFIENIWLPYFRAIEEIQLIFDKINGNEPREVSLRNLSQNSPISVSVDGAAQAIDVVRESVVPWRKKHAEEMARLQELEKQAEIEKLKAEVLERRANAEKGRAEAAKQWEEAEKIKLETEKLRVDLYGSKVELTIKLINSISPCLSENERVAMIVRLLPQIEILITSELSIQVN